MTTLYYAVQETLRTNECDLPVYRLMCQWEESNDTPWYVVLIGEKLPSAVHQRLTTVLARGEISDIPQQALYALLIR